MLTIKYVQASFGVSPAKQCPTSLAFALHHPRQNYSSRQTVPAVVPHTAGPIPISHYHKSHTRHDIRNLKLNDPHPATIKKEMHKENQ